MLVLYSALVKVIMAKLRLNTTDNSFVKPTSGVQHAVTVAKLAVDRPQTANIPPNHITCFPLSTHVKYRRWCGCGVLELLKDMSELRSVRKRM